MSILSKSYQAVEAWLDSSIAKAKVSNAEKPAYDHKGLVEIDYGTEQQWGWKEKRGLVGPGVLKNMSRKDSIVAAIVQTRVNQVSRFTKLQPDKYSPGFKIVPNKPADIEPEDKLALADPALDDEAHEQLNYEMEQKRSKLQKTQEEEMDQIAQFVMNCGEAPDDENPMHTKIDFDVCVKLWVIDKMVHNYTATELVPTKSREKLHHWYPVSAGTIRHSNPKSADAYEKSIKEALNIRLARLLKDVPKGQMNDKAMKDAYDKEAAKPYKYLQVIRGKVEAAWTEDEMAFEAGNPTVDPEDNGYAPGELEQLIHIVTAHLYAEAHNRNYFTQGIGSKGILHIKGENLSRGQLEAFKRQSFNQLASSRNSFRPPIIGLADEVKWIELAQSNKDMEFDNWMHYLIKVMCAVFQIDPAEINFDISKGNTSTLNEANNEERLKSSKDKGLQPLLDYIENLINRKILPKWNKEFAAKYQFKFVGLDAESREQEVKRLEGETKVWKTLNEARIEMGRAPIEHGDVVLNATYTQYLQQVAMAAQQEAGMLPGMGGDEMGGGEETDEAGDHSNLESELDSIEADVRKEVDGDAKDAEKEAKAADTKKSLTTIEYFVKD